MGVDHCGHRYGPLHSEMVRKLTEMNQVIEDTLQTMDNETVLFVIGDHGMTATGMFSNVICIFHFVFSILHYYMVID